MQMSCGVLFVIGFMRFHSTYHTLHIHANGGWLDGCQSNLNKFQLWSPS